jgi:cyclophilin family peptidyl-prolyl cis-trans isomerase
MNAAMVATIPCGYLLESMIDPEIRELERRVQAGEEDLREALERAQVRAGFERRARISTRHGDMVVQFFQADAPRHVENFCSLVKKGFYEGLIFHRVIKDFMIQGGCPQGTGVGGPGYKIKQEFNSRLHVRGVLSMARAADPDSAGSQFFIVHGRSVPHLDRHYTVFGRLASGLDVLDAIAVAPVGPSDRPREPVAMKIRLEYLLPE